MINSIETHKTYRILKVLSSQDYLALDLNDCYYLVCTLPPLVLLPAPPQRPTDHLITSFEQLTFNDMQLCFFKMGATEMPLLKDILKDCSTHTQKPVVKHNLLLSALTHTLDALLYYTYSEISPCIHASNLFVLENRVKLQLMPRKQERMEGKSKGPLLLVNQFSIISHFGEVLEGIFHDQSRDGRLSLFRRDILSAMREKQITFEEIKRRVKLNQEQLTLLRERKQYKRSSVLDRVDIRGVSKDTRQLVPLEMFKTRRKESMFNFTKRTSQPMGRLQRFKSLSMPIDYSMNVRKINPFYSQKPYRTIILRKEGNVQNNFSVKSKNIEGRLLNRTILKSEPPQNQLKESRIIDEARLWNRDYFQTALKSRLKHDRKVFEARSPEVTQISKQKSNRIEEILASQNEVERNSRSRLTNPKKQKRDIKRSKRLEMPIEAEQLEQIVLSERKPIEKKESVARESKLPEVSVSERVDEFITLINVLGDICVKTVKGKERLKGFEWKKATYFLYQRFLYERMRLLARLQAGEVIRRGKIEISEAAWSVWLKGKNRQQIIARIREQNTIIETTLKKLGTRLLQECKLERKTEYYVRNMSIILTHSPSSRTVLSKHIVRNVAEEFDEIQEKNIKSEEICAHVRDLVFGMQIVGELDGKGAEEDIVKLEDYRKQRDGFAGIEDIVDRFYDTYFPEERVRDTNS